MEVDYAIGGVFLKNRNRCANIRCMHACITGYLHVFASLARDTGSLGFWGDLLMGWDGLEEMVCR